VATRHQGPFIFHGMVYDDNGQPALDVELSLNQQIKARSDFNGRFFFADIVPGEYELSATGKNLETLKRSVYVSQSTEVLYLSMVSIDGLYRSCIASLDAKAWGAADTYIDRALAVSPTAPLLRYAKAVSLSVPSRPDRKWQEADALLRSLTADGYDEPAIYLLLADICQYDREDMEQAVGFLEHYLKLEYDPGVEERMKSLLNSTTM